MRLGKTTILSLTLLSASLGLRAGDVTQVISALDSLTPFAASVAYSVTLPQAQDEVLYEVNLQSPTAGSFLIEWSVESPAGTRQGWTARSDGHFYNYRDRRLQEIHSGWDPQSPPKARFEELLPENIASQLRQMQADTAAYSLSVIPSARALTVNALRRSSGQTDAEFSWEFDPQSMRPLRFSADYNPGAISSQQVLATYSPLKSEVTLTALDEDSLRARYPEAFALHRESNFAIEHMRGELLPDFSLPLADGSGRMSRRRGDKFREPTVVVLLDPQSPLAQVLVDDVRSAINSYPGSAEVIWACSERNPESAIELLGAELPQGETALCGAKSLAADCGAAALPVVLVCSPDGTISNLLIGLNKQTRTDVIQLLTQLLL